MIHTIVGLMNSGKTLFMTYKLYKDFKEGREIVSNYSLSFPHKLVNKDYILQLAKEQPPLNNISFGFDELWVWLGSRSFASKDNILATNFFLQSSKGDCNIYLTTQDNSQNDIRIRQNQHFVSVCERRILIEGKYKRLSDEKRVLPLNLQELLYINYKTFGYRFVNYEKISYLKERGFIKAKSIFELFDTHQKIKVY